MSLNVSKSYGETDFVTGLRAYAAFAVLLIHSGGAGLRELGDFGNTMADFGRSGVYAFFVISGFSVATSYNNSEGYFSYILKRLWRVAPLYYFWISLATYFSLTAIFWQKEFNVSVDAYNLIMHLSFLSFLDYRIANTILGVEWSIAIEVFWYFFVPVILFIKSGRFTLLLIGSLLVYVLFKKFAYILPIPLSEAKLAIHWSPVPYAFAYCLGVLALKVRNKSTGIQRFGNLVLVSIIFLILLYAAKIAMLNKTYIDEFLFTSLLTFALIIAGSNNSFLFRLILSNKLVIFLGSISYGVYLSHFPLMNLIRGHSDLIDSNAFLFFVSLSFASIGTSVITYYLIEIPGIWTGKKLMGKKFL